MKKIKLIVDTPTTDKKYELTKQAIVVNGKKLYRIKALKDFTGVRAGDFGGWVQSEKNLSQEGESWIFDEAMAFENALVTGNAKLHGEAKVYGEARVDFHAAVFDNACICEQAEVTESALIYDSAIVSGNAFIYGNALICDRANIFDYAQVCEKARVDEDASVCGNALVYGNACVSGEARVRGRAIVCDNSSIWGKASIKDAYVGGYTQIACDAKIEKDNDFMFSSIAGDITFYKCFDGSIKVQDFGDFGNRNYDKSYKLDEFIDMIPSFQDKRREIISILCQLAKAYMDK